ncbi:MAG TPA: peptide-methionine (S)-S-oxide reductase [Flavobacteriaceae bacterium]|nr:peptide-methionine (S)-S-oxide reductase [Flavobacteriaceae bacterium]
MKKIILIILAIGLLSFIANNNQENKNIMNKQEIATFGGGCFWCTEAVFSELKGVENVESGYSGGKLPNPTYKDISTGTTGHAEVIHITFNPEKIHFSELLDVFFATHNPTTLNRQGADVGTQYRSVVFYHNDNQKTETEKFIKALEKEHVFEDEIVTEITKFDIYYKAEAYHQDFYKNNQENRYCNAVLNPKLIKFRKQFKDKLKGN